MDERETGPRERRCPECGAARGADNTPSCACTQRASDALREARTAEQAAAEDFDPLRIRPYVELEGGGAEPAAGAPRAAGTAGPAAGTAGAARVPAAEETRPLRAVPPEDADTAPALPAPPVPEASPPSAADVRLFEGTAPGRGPGPYGTEEAPVRHGRGRRAVLLAAAAAAAGVVAVAGLAAGLFSYDIPSRDGAAPDVRAAVPDTTVTSAAAQPAAPGTAATSARPASPSPSASPSSSPSPSPSPSPSRPSASPTPSRTASPTPTAAASQPEETPAPDEDARSPDAPVLRRGDHGPEVAELQLRLHQLYLYNGAPDGRFDSEVEDALRTYQWTRGIRTDQLGVYGPETRAKLESETREP